MVDFFVCKKIILKERMVFDMKITKEELQFEESLKQRREFICEFAKFTLTFINGSIKKFGKTNITYIEPHYVHKIKNYTKDVKNITKNVRSVNDLNIAIKIFEHSFFEIEKENNSLKYQL